MPPLAPNGVGLCKSRFLLYVYSTELLMEYSSTQLIPEVIINYRVARKKRTLNSLFKFVIQKRF